MFRKLTMLALLKQLNKVTKERVRDVELLQLSLEMIKRVYRCYPHIAQECFNKEEMKTLIMREIKE